MSVLETTGADLENGVLVLPVLGDDGVVRIMVVNHKYRLDRETTISITLPASIPDDTPVTSYLIDSEHSNWYDTGGSTDFLEIVDSPSIVAGTMTVTVQPRSVLLLVFAQEDPVPPPAIPANVRSYTLSAARAELGFNISTSDPALLPAAASYNASVVRVQMGWDAVEDYGTGDLALTATWQDFLDGCVTENLKPVVLAAYGPPWTQLSSLTVTNDVAAGATTIQVDEDPSAIDFPYCFVHSLTGRISGLADNYGSLITSVSAGPNTITVASATNVPLAAGQELVIIRRRYPPPQTPDQADASIVAYARYAEFLAQEIANRGLAGWVEIWNEPTWGSDRWEGIGNYYDVPGSLPVGWLSLKYFLLALQDLAPITGVQYVNGAANLSWGGSMKALGIYDYTSPAADFVNLWGDSIHPYNGNPENMGVYWSGCSTYNLDPIWSGSNYRGIPEDDCFWQDNNPGEAGPLCMATETNCGGLSSDAAGWRWIRRRVASLWASRVSPVTVYDLTNDGGDPLDAATSGRGTALTSLNAAVLALGGDGTTDSIPTLDTVGTGDWDIMYANVYGANGCVTLLWQRTADASDWENMPRPDPVDVTLNAAPGYSFVSATYLEDNTGVPLNAPFPVTDDILMIVSELSSGPSPSGTVEMQKLAGQAWQAVAADQHHPGALERQWIPGRGWRTVVSDEQEGTVERQRRPGRAWDNYPADET